MATHCSVRFGNPCSLASFWTVSLLLAFRENQILQPLAHSRKQSETSPLTHSKAKPEQTRSRRTAASNFLPIIPQNQRFSLAPATATLYVASRNCDVLSVDVCSTLMSDQNSAEDIFTATCKSHPRSERGARIIPKNASQKSVDLTVPTSACWREGREIRPFSIC